MKIGIYTSALGVHISGGILAIIETLNALVKRGHECVCFVDDPPYRSDWLETKFLVKPSSEVDKYDGILVSPYSPTAEKVAFAKNAEERLLWCHTNESLFCHNGPAFQDMARRSYHLPLKIFCTSSYLQIIMETIFNRYVIGTLVPPGVDTEVFRPAKEIQNKDRIVIGYLHRPEWVRGLDVMEDIIRKINITQLNIPLVFLPIGHVSDRNMMANNYRAMDIYLDMSRVSGSPVPVKEAMACGAIPICTKYGTTDFVLGGYNGYIVPVDDVSYAVDMIQRFVMWPDELRTKIAQNAVETMQDYTWENIAMLFERAIEEGKSRGDDLLKNRNWKIQR